MKTREIIMQPACTYIVMRGVTNRYQIVIISNGIVSENVKYLVSSISRYKEASTHH